MQRPPPYELTEPVHTTGVAPPGFKPQRETRDELITSGMFGAARSMTLYEQEVQSFIIPLDNEFQHRTALIPQTIETDLAAARREIPMPSLPAAQAIIRELGIRSTVIHRKNLELQQQTAISHGFYGSDPTDKTAHQFIARAAVVDRHFRPTGPGFKLWRQSYRAAYEARLLIQTLSLLNQQQLNVQNWLTSVQASDQVQMAAQQEAQRAAAEQARINEQAARLQKEQQEIHAREQARLAALAEAQRLANEQVQIAAEAAAQQIAAEQARLQAQADIQRHNEERRQLAEKTRQEKQQEALRKAQKKRRKKARKTAREQAQLLTESAKSGQPLVFTNTGSMAAFGPTFTGPMGGIGNNPVTALALRTSLRTAVSLALAGISTAAAPVIVGFAALLIPSKLGNGELYSASVPLSDLAPDLNSDTLHQLAAIGGEIDLPVRLGSITMGNNVEFVVVTTDGLTVPANVPVRAAHFDASKNAYVSTASDTNGPTLTWTPLVTPMNSSTDLPQADTDPPVDDGAEIAPELNRYGFGGFITVFPIESGIPPLLVVFSSPYEGGVEDGEHSGRAFNPKEIGGSILDLEWAPVTPTPEGASTVKLHISKFPESAANKVMLDRLERIIRGELEPTDTDKRFYTHELREFERFKALGYGDTERPDPNSSVWNNVHTATLEDFKLKDDDSLLYTPEALAADAEQVELEYQQLLKEMWK
jgi:hypothetical protein